MMLVLEWQRAKKKKNNKNQCDFNIREGNLK